MLGHGHHISVSGTVISPRVCVNDTITVSDRPEISKTVMICSSGSPVLTFYNIWLQRVNSHAAALIEVSTDAEKMYKQQITANTHTHPESVTMMEGDSGGGGR